MPEAVFSVGPVLDDPVVQFRKRVEDIAYRIFMYARSRAAETGEAEDRPESDYDHRYYPVTITAVDGGTPTTYSCRLWPAVTAVTWSNVQNAGDSVLAAGDTVILVEQYYQGTLSQTRILESGNVYR